ncbi:MAG TPA: flagellar basal body L-ring protein FlgH [Bryobacteraceae bacterium]|nr:flagellar basal body L-ring protein FlgH [Bryobacteraceae bacterium]
MSSFPRVLVLILAGALALAARGKKQEPGVSALDRYIAEATARGREAPQASPGSLWRPGAALGNLGGDLRASQVDELITIIVAESASAVSSGSVKTQRTTSANASVTALGRKLPAGGALPNLLQGSSNASIDGAGSTGRQTVISATLSARITHVLPNGNLVVEGSKIVRVNAEQQLVALRGVIRPTDLGTDNTVSSERVAQMEVTVNGKGVVGDAIRRPFFLYRLLLGLLPF